MLGWLVYQNVSMCLNHHVPILNRTVTRQERSRSTRYLPEHIFKVLKATSVTSHTHTHAHRHTHTLWLLVEFGSSHIKSWSQSPCPVTYVFGQATLLCISRWAPFWIAYSLTCSSCIHYKRLEKKRQLYTQGRGEIRSALTWLSFSVTVFRPFIIWRSNNLVVIQ